MSWSAEPEVVLAGDAPIHCQVYEQIRACIVSGRLHAGEQLQSIRALAVGLAVNPVSIQRAYAALEHDGLVSTADQSGPLVASPPADSLTPAERQARLEELCVDFFTRSVSLGLTLDQAVTAAQAIAQRSHAS